MPTGVRPRKPTQARPGARGGGWTSFQLVFQSQTPCTGHSRPAGRLRGGVLVPALSTAHGLGTWGDSCLFWQAPDLPQCTAEVTGADGIRCGKGEQARKTPIRTTDPSSSSAHLKTPFPTHPPSLMFLSSRGSAPPPSSSPYPTSTASSFLSQAEEPPSCPLTMADHRAPSGRASTSP